jgi:predicted Zn finger-like uncharacterized protein
MIVICEKCGKKYRIDPAKIIGKAASFKCHICSHVIMAYKSEEFAESHHINSDAKSIVDKNDQTVAAKGDYIPAAAKTGDVKSESEFHRKTRGISLRAKMLIVFVFIPIIIIAMGSLYYLWHIETTSRLLIEESSKITTKLADDKISSAKAANAMMQNLAHELTNKARWIALMVFGVTLLLVGITVTSYVYRLTGKIRKLAEKAERIGSGEFEVAMETDSGDEIGDLKRAIAKMQNNIQLYIERLQQRQ